VRSTGSGEEPILNASDNERIAFALD
jgi:hypothetical protein